MGVYVPDAAAAIDLAERGWSGGSSCELFAPTLLRSQVLSILHRDVIAGTRDNETARELAERASRLPHRLLGDAVLRRTAWTIATEQGWPDTYEAEYIALTRLHGVGLIAADPVVQSKAQGVVPCQTVDSFVAATGAG